MIAMPSVSKNLKEIYNDSTLKEMQHLAPSPQTGAGTCAVFMSYDGSSSMGKIYLD